MITDNYSVLFKKKRIAIAEEKNFKFHKLDIRIFEIK